jgi:glycerophosphoryl diester phosphodiesterase
MPPRAELPELATWVDQVNPSHCLVNAYYVDAVHSSGMECLLWTVNRVHAMKRARRLGADGIITDRPDVLHRVLGSALPRAS